MKKREIEINLTNYWLYALIVIGILAAVGIGVYAYGTSSPSTFGHSSGEIDFSGGITTPNLTTNKICLSGVCNTAWPSCPLCTYSPSETQLLATTSGTVVYAPTSSSYVKAKEIRVGGPGNYTVKFVLASIDTSTTFHARIYVNGVAVGPEQAYKSSSVTDSRTFSQYIPAQSNDLVQLYTINPNGFLKLGIFQIYGKIYDFTVTID